MPADPLETTTLARIQVLELYQEHSEHTTIYNQVRLSRCRILLHRSNRWLAYCHHQPDSKLIQVLTYKVTLVKDKIQAAVKVEFK